MPQVQLFMHIQYFNCQHINHFYLYEEKLQIKSYSMRASNYEEPECFPKPLLIQPQ